MPMGTNEIQNPFFIALLDGVVNNKEPTAIQRIWTAATKEAAFSIARSNASPSFEAQKSILDEMAEFVKILAQSFFLWD